MTDVQRVSPSAWEWHVGHKGYGVRVFASTRKLIYSSWTDTPEGPLFSDGISQTFNQFRAGEIPPFDLPQEVVNGLHDWLKSHKR